MRELLTLLTAILPITAFALIGAYLPETKEEQQLYLFGTSGVIPAVGSLVAVVGAIAAGVAVFLSNRRSIEVRYQSGLELISREGVSGPVGGIWVLHQIARGDPLAYLVPTMFTLQSFIYDRCRHITDPARAAAKAKTTGPSFPPQGDYAVVNAIVACTKMRRGWLRPWPKDLVGKDDNLIDYFSEIWTEVFQRQRGPKRRLRGNRNFQIHSAYLAGNAFTGRNFRFIELYRMVFSKVSFVECKFGSTVIEGVVDRYVGFVGCDLRQCQLRLTDPAGIEIGSPGCRAIVELNGECNFAGATINGREVTTEGKFGEKWPEPPSG